MNKKTIKAVGISILFLFIGAMMIKYFLDKEKLEKDYRITIANIYQYETLSRSGYDLYFSYTVDGKKYESDYIVYDNPKIYVGKNFFVRFSPKNPKNCEVLLNQPVPNHIDKTPLNGWKEIPH